MRYTQGKFQVVSKKLIAKGMYDFEIKCEEVAQIAKEGQFVHILAQGHPLRRPISIAGIDRENGTIRVIFEVRGEGTSKISQIKENEFVDMIAPLGIGFKLFEKDKKVICVGGGIGTPPMLPIAQHYGENATVISGFRNSDAVILQNDFTLTGAKTVLCTDDGSCGTKGFVTTALLEELKNVKPDAIYACGPTPMLKAVADVANTQDIFCQVSLEERMGCGVGACLVCACKTVRNGEEHYAHVCQDGPVFNSQEVIF